MSNKLREALCKVHNTLSFWDWGKMQNLIDDDIKIIDEALAEPLRNCDVGTAEEQEERFSEFCLTRKCIECQLYKTEEFFQCGVRWSQMPYESEVSK